MGPSFQEVLGMPTNRHFDLLAPLYDRFFGVGDPGILLEAAALPARGRLLDVGGGTGRITRSLRIYAEEVVLADVSLGMLQMARGAGLPVVCAPAERLPFGPNVFSRVIMVDALHHVQSQGRTVRELWRVLRPGGIAVIEEPDIRTLPVRIVAVIEKLLWMRSHFLSPPQIASLFAFPEARVDIRRDGTSAWVVAEKVDD